MVDIAASLLILIAVGVAVSALNRFPLLQIFVIIVSAYTIFFPMLDFMSSPYPFTRTFLYHQIVFGVFFLAPLVFFISRGAVKLAGKATTVSPPVELNHYTPIILIASLALFTASSILYNLYFVRIGYGDFLLTTGSTPTVLLFHYRMMAETSFFVIIYLIAAVRAGKGDAYRKYYMLALGLYVLTFSPFFLINSRMQFLLLLILVLVSNYEKGRINFPRLIAVVVSVVTLAIALTLLREFIIEDNGRLDASSSASLIRETVWLISGRLNSLTMIDTAGETGYNIFAPNLYGFWFVIKFNLSPIFDPAFYAYIKSIEQTSPSVYIMNTILLRNDVDFPKSMAVETVLMLGALGLPALAYVISRVMIWIQRKLRYDDISSVGFVLALYFLPLVYQFEKEFSGVLLSALKWSPMAAFLIISRPRRVSRGVNSRQLAHV